MKQQPYLRRVHYYETDQMAIVHHSNYIRWFEEARLDFLNQIGLNYRAMEEQGIGRPSTYAPTVSTILDREYVIKEGKYLHITNLGRAVTEWMKEWFTDIADLKFTANMEQKLDSVEEGSTPWKDVLRNFYGDFDQGVQKAEEGPRIKVPDEVSEEICP